MNTPADRTWRDLIGVTTGQCGEAFAVDYLYPSFTNATAFSPTDVMPLAAWAQIAMAVQSLVSLSIVASSPREQ